MLIASLMVWLQEKNVMLGKLMTFHHASGYIWPQQTSFMGLFEGTNRTRLFERIFLNNLVLSTQNIQFLDSLNFITRNIKLYVFRVRVTIGFGGHICHLRRLIYTLVGTQHNIRLLFVNISLLIVSHYSYHWNIIILSGSMISSLLSAPFPPKHTCLLLMYYIILVL